MHQSLGEIASPNLNNIVYAIKMVFQKKKLESSPSPRLGSRFEILHTDVIDQIEEE